MQTEAVSNSAIPTPLDYLHAVGARMIDSAVAESPDVGLMGELATVYTTTTASDDSLLEVLAFAHGCFAAAEIYRAQDDTLADLYTSMGQDLIVKAMHMFTVLMVLGLAHLNVPRN